MFASIFGSGVISSFLTAFSVIIVSELGDKTFFIAAILSMNYSKWVVFLGAISALGFMTVLSAVVGILTMIVPKIFLIYFSAILFFIFGLKMLKEAYSMKSDEGKEELESVKRKLLEKEEEIQQEIKVNIDNNSQEENNINVDVKRKRIDVRQLLNSFFSPVFIQSFLLTLVAEMGDRSQISTFILATKNNLFGVITGSFIAHAFCTGLAVHAGHFVAERVSMRTVHFVGGIVFMISAFYTLFFESQELKN